MAVACFEDILSSYDDRPHVIRSALARAYVHPAFHHLSMETRGVLLSLLARLSRWKPWSTFGARADRCSLEVGVSRKTYTRAVARFIEAGWMVEDGGGRTSMGRFGAYRYRFTDLLLSMVGLNKDSLQQQETGVSHGLLVVDVHLKEDHQEPIAHICANSQTQAINPLPDDVAVLEAEYGVHPLMVYRLMGVMGRAGCRLGDVLVVALPYLRKLGLFGSRAYRYLEAMTKKGKGYANRASVAREDAKSKQLRDELSSRGNRYDGMKYLSGNGTIIEIEAGRAYLHFADGRKAAVSGAGMVKIYEDIEAGVITPILQPGSPRSHNPKASEVGNLTALANVCGNASLSDHSPHLLAGTTSASASFSSPVVPKRRAHESQISSLPRSASGATYSSVRMLLRSISSGFPVTAPSASSRTPFGEL